MREGGGGKAWNLSSREHRPWPDLGVSGGVLVAPAAEAKFHKAKPERKSGECQFLSGRILAKSLVPEPKTSLKCPFL